MLKKSSTRTKKALPASRVIRTNSGTRIKIERGIEYVLPLGNGWVVKNGGASKFTAITDTKKEAISIARKIARTNNFELIVHGRNGDIEIHETY